MRGCLGEYAGFSFLLNGTGRQHRRGSNLFATGLELPRSEGREAGLVINEERPLVIRMGERDYSVPGVDVDQMEAFLYVLGKLHDAFGKGT